MATTCSYLTATDTPYGQLCGQPPAGKWHDSDDEWFCLAHLGDDVAAADMSICPRCFALIDYTPDLPECGNCGHQLAVLADTPDQPARR